MGTLGDVVACLHKVLDRCGQAREDLNQGADLLEAANAEYAHAMDGAQDPDAGEALGLLARGVADLNETYRALVSTEDRIEGYITALAGTGRARADSASEQDIRPARGRHRSPQPAPTRKRIEQLRAELPPPVVPGSGQKTHGRWIDADGKTHAEVSGKDAKYQQAVQLLKDMKARRIPVTASDVEMKLAAHMRKNGIRSAILVINHTPCDGPLGCDALIGVILPKGYTLTVYGADGFFREYEGGKTSTWLP